MAVSGANPTCPGGSSGHRESGTSRASSGFGWRFLCFWVGRLSDTKMMPLLAAGLTAKK